MANEILPFGLGAESNVMTQAGYEALAARSGGFSSGVAKSEQLNKVWRQSSSSYQRQDYKREYHSESGV